MNTSETTEILFNKICKKCKIDYDTVVEKSTHCKECFKSDLNNCLRCGDKFFTNGFKTHCNLCYKRLQEKKVGTKV